MGQPGQEFRGGTLKTGPFGKHPSFYPLLILGEKKKNSPASDKNVDTKRVDTIVVVHGLTELSSCRLSPWSHEEGRFTSFYTPPFIFTLNSTLLKPKMIY